MAYIGFDLYQMNYCEDCSTLYLQRAPHRREAMRYFWEKEILKSTNRRG